MGVNYKPSIENCGITDTDAILALYTAARNLQTQKGMVVWPVFDREFVEAEIAEQRQWKLVVNNTIACNWAITFDDKQIWEEKERGDAIYLHRIATHPQFRGNRYIDDIVTWAKEYARQLNRKYVRLDTLGNNTKLIEHYTSAGFQFLGIHRLKDISGLPDHYHREPDCLLFEMAL